MLLRCGWWVQGWEQGEGAPALKPVGLERSVRQTPQVVSKCGFWPGRPHGQRSEVRPGRAAAMVGGGLP